ncbi:MAG: 5-(carboxyamino)imidazole ribonucleotide synthase [Planctomycetes bacterium]|nr:5-(carboxyamino)imidazole ribonucleotide synthase [Planctomycetota bacterium]
MTTVAILGGGQLARMLAIAGHRLGVQCRTLDPEAESSASPVAESIHAPWNDHRAVGRLAAGATVATFEREHLPLSTVTELAQLVPLRPGPEALQCLQHRGDQRRFLARLGLEQPKVAFPTDENSYRRALADMGLPVVVKSARDGYDGRGQCVVRSAADAAWAWTELSASDLVVERFVPFDEELALVAVRGSNGEFSAWPLVRTYQVDGVLAMASPMSAAGALQVQAEAITRRIADALGYIGVLCVEFFRVGERLLINEVAPRVHNSGHWTIEGAECSQFENHLRAILGWPLGSTALRGASAVVNLIGAMPERARALRVPGVHWHDYGKRPRPGRKVGHLTITAPSADELDERLGRLRSGGISIPAHMTSSTLG